MGILQLPPSIRPSRYLLLDDWSEFKQIWYKAFLYPEGVQEHSHILPHPLGPLGEIYEKAILSLIIYFYYRLGILKYSGMKKASKLDDIFHVTLGSCPMGLT